MSSVYISSEIELLDTFWTSLYKDYELSVPGIYNGVDLEVVWEVYELLFRGLVF